MKISRPILAIAIAASLAAVGVGCTPSAQEPTAAASSTPTPEVDPVITLNDETGARAELTDFVCSVADGTWKTSGTVTNPTDADAVYVVNVAVIDSDTRSSLVRRNFQLEVGPKESAEFSEEKFATDIPDVGHECVVRVSRGTGVAE